MLLAPVFLYLGRQGQLGLRRNGDDFQVSPALGTRQDLALQHILYRDARRALWALGHRHSSQFVIVTYIRYQSHSDLFYAHFARKTSDDFVHGNQ